MIISHNQSLLKALDCEVLVATIKDKTVKRYEGGGISAWLERQEQLAAKREKAAAK